MRTRESDRQKSDTLTGKKVLKGALVGIGGYGLNHLGSLRQLAAENRIQLCAAVHTGAEHEKKTARELEKEGCILYLSVEEMLADWGKSLDFCTLPTSIASHVPLVLRCLELGIHCLVEKPLTGDISQLAQLEEAMIEHPSVLVTVGFQTLFLPEIMMIRERIREGYIGQLKRIKVFGAWPRSHSYYKRNNWAGKIRIPDCTIYDSPLNNAMAHYLNLGLYWASGSSGETARVQSVEGALYRAQDIENFDTASCRFCLDTGLSVGAWVTHSSKNLLNITIVIEGEKGSLTWGRGDCICWEVEGETTTVKSTPIREASLAMFRDFVDAVCGEERPQCKNVPQAASHVRAIQMLQSKIPVQDVAPALIEKLDRNGEESTVIAGVEDLFMEGFRTDTLVTLPTA